MSMAIGLIAFVLASGCLPRRIVPPSVVVMFIAALSLFLKPQAFGSSLGIGYGPALAGTDDGGLISEIFFLGLIGGLSTRTVFLACETSAAWVGGVFFSGDCGHDRSEMSLIWRDRSSCLRLFSFLFLLTVVADLGLFERALVPIFDFGALPAQFGLAQGISLNPNVWATVVNWLRLGLVLGFLLSVPVFVASIVWDGLVVISARIIARAISPGEASAGRMILILIILIYSWEFGADKVKDVFVLSGVP